MFSMNHLMVILIASEHTKCRKNRKQNKQKEQTESTFLVTTT
jgi:hypothetical protein